MTKAWYELDSRPTGVRYWAAVVRKQPSAILVGIQLLAIVLLPWVESENWGRPVITSLSLFAVTFGIWVVRSTPALTWLALGIGFPAFVLEVWSVIDQSNVPVTFAAHLLLAVFYIYVAYGLVAYMFADTWVTKDELFAVGAAFTVLLFGFTYLFVAIQTLAPGSFDGHTGIGQKSSSSCSTSPRPTSRASACRTSWRSSPTPGRRRSSSSWAGCSTSPWSSRGSWP